MAENGDGTRRRAGELLRPWLISRRHPIATSAGFATIILERLLDLITVLDDAQDVLQAIFQYYEHRGFEPSVEEEQIQLNL